MKRETKRKGILTPGSIEKKIHRERKKREKEKKKRYQYSWLQQYSVLIVGFSSGSHTHGSLGAFYILVHTCCVHLLGSSGCE